MDGLLIFPVIFPILMGIAILLAKPNKRALHALVLASLCLNAVVTFVLILFGGDANLVIVRFTDGFTLSLGVDGMSRLFSGMISVLWVFTAIYAFGYMPHEGMETKFYGFFTMTAGVVCGIAFSKNLPTLYVFYEYLTFATLPLVMHQMSSRSRYAGKVYLIYSMGGGALAFGGIVYLLTRGVSLDFVYGGNFTSGNAVIARAVFVVMFFGFGVKAAVFPLCGWLPKASVAPTPVTALLHAVAVVKSGVFAIARITYYIFGTEILADSYAQDVMVLFSSFTIVYGSMMALRMPHLKRRLAYSTVSNLSYIIFGLSVMAREALTGAMLHMMFHAVIKITLFFCAGSILVRTGDEYVYELKGYAKRMPVTMACFAICGLGLIGIPPFAAFYSKYVMATTAIGIGRSVTYVGIGALMLSEFLTALYILKPVINAYFPTGDSIVGEKDGDCGASMTVPIVILSIVSIAMAFGAGAVFKMIDSVI